MRAILMTLAIGAWLASYLPARAVPAVGVVVFDGDSVSHGTGASSPDMTPDQQLARIMHRPLQLTNVGVPGQAVFQCLAKFPHVVAPLYEPGAAFNIIAFHAGDNDIAHGMNAQQTYASLTRYIALAHAHGWKVVLTTELDRPSWPPERREYLAQYNEMMLRNSAGADAVFDYENAPGMNPPVRALSRLYSGDQVHPNDRGYTILARAIAGMIRQLVAEQRR